MKIQLLQQPRIVTSNNFPIDCCHIRYSGTFALLCLFLLFVFFFFAFPLLSREDVMFKLAYIRLTSMHYLASDCTIKSLKWSNVRVTC